MKLLMPFPYLHIFDRYHAQMHAIAQRIDTFHIAHTAGTPTDEWRKHFTFHQFMHHPYQPERVGWRRRVTRLPKAALRLIQSKRKLAEAYKHADLDVCYSLASFWQLSLTAHLAKQQDIPYVARVRGRIFYELECTQDWLTRRFYTSRLSQLLRDADLVIPISRAARDDLEEQGLPLDNVSAPVGLGVDTAEFEDSRVFGFAHARDADELRLGYAGRLSQEKGIYRLGYLAQQLPHIDFLVAGRRQCPITFPKNVAYFGRLPHHFMPSFYDLCDAIILPSFTEGIPNTVLEAYAYGKPILATKEAFPSELKVFGKVGDIAEFPAFIEQLQHEDLEAQGRKARRYVKTHFSWDRFGESMVRLLSTLR